MILRLKRHYKKDCTRGELWIEDTKFCNTIEPAFPFRGGYIPEGYYRVTVTISPRFGRLLPLLHNVPGRSGIRIHSGLSVRNTSGCICVGKRITEEQITAILKKHQDDGETNYIIISSHRANDDYYDAKQLQDNAPNAG